MCMHSASNGAFKNTFSALVAIADANFIHFDCSLLFTWIVKCFSIETTWHIYSEWPELSSRLKVLSFRLLFALDMYHSGIGKALNLLIYEWYHNTLCVFFTKKAFSFLLLRTLSGACLVQIIWNIYDIISKVFLRLHFAVGSVWRDIRNGAKYLLSGATCIDRVQTLHSHTHMHINILTHRHRHKHYS